MAASDVTDGLETALTDSGFGQAYQTVVEWGAGPLYRFARK
jgi:hypothetical protein